MGTPSTLACKGAILSLLQHGPKFRHNIREELEHHFGAKMVYATLDELEQDNRIISILVIGSGMRFELTPAEAAEASETPPSVDFFAYRHITPLFAGNPEWIVEALQPEGNRLVCWCHREFNAALITAALNGDKS